MDESWMLKHLVAAAMLLLLLPAASALLYGLCDAVDRAGGVLDCNISEQRYEFSQQDVDLFWQELAADENYQNGSISEVKWLIAGAVVNITDDVAFIEGSDVDIPWDIELRGDANTVYDVNWGAATEVYTEATHTAIRTTKVGLRHPLVSFSPREGRRTVRHITLSNPTGFATYISGSIINPMEIDTEGNIELSDSYIENISSLDAKDLNLSDGAFVKNAESIRAENLVLGVGSHIGSVGALGETAIKLHSCSTGLELTGGSWIRDVLGRISVDGDIALTASRIETLQQKPANVIEGIEAKDLTMDEASEISGVGGEIALQGSLSLDENSTIVGRSGNKVNRLAAKSIVLDNYSEIKNIGEVLEVTGNDLFEVKGGAKILSQGSRVTSCAPLELDGNWTKIEFALNNGNEVRAPSLDVNLGAEIGCENQGECSYSFLLQVCDLKPVADLDINGDAVGYAPLAVTFAGACSDNEELAGCEISYGDGSNAESFLGEARHMYYYPGTYTAVLTATDSNGQTGSTEETVTVLEREQEPDQNVGEIEVQATVSSSTVRQGGIIFIELDLNVELAELNVKSSLGISQELELPESFPARLGPFQVGQDVAPGSYTFTVTGAAESGAMFSKTLVFRVEEKEEPGWQLPIPLELILVIVVVAGIGIAALLFLKKRRAEAGEEKPAAEEKWEAGGKPAEKKAEEKPAAEKKPEEKPAEGASAEKPAEKGSEAGAAPGKGPAGEEVPPWLKEEEEEEE